MTTVLVVTIVFSLIGVLAQRFGADTRPGVDDPPEGWVGHRPRT
jgi:hypothetical protein